MNDLNRALGEIRDIRRQVAQSTEFRGYGPLTLASTAALAIVAAVAQAVWASDPTAEPLRYIAIWSATAMFSAAFIASQTLARAQRMHSGMADEMIHMAVEQFLPAALAGTLVTAVIVHFAWSSGWMLPGLWQIIYSLGIFSSCRFLPRPLLGAGAWYLVSGLASLSLADSRAMNPWLMAVAFGVGQSLIAGILYFAAKNATTESAHDA